MHSTCLNLSRPIRFLVLLGTALLSHTAYESWAMEADRAFREAALASLKKFERIHWGLEFQAVQADRSRRVEISSDGRVARVVSVGQSRHGIQHHGAYANTDLMLHFSVSDEEPKDQHSETHSPRRRRGLMVRYFDDQQDPLGLLGDVEFGRLGHLPISRWIEESEITVVLQQMENQMYRGVRLKHSAGISVVLFNDSMDVAYLIYQARPGHTIGGSKYEPPTTVSSAEWSELVFGPIQYGVMSERQVIVQIPNSVKASGDISGGAIHRFFDHRPLPRRLPARISIPDFDLQNGERVTMPGQVHRSFEFHNGQIVPVADSNSLRAAERARLLRSITGTPWYYVVLGTCCIAVLLFMLWYRNRN